MGIFDSVYVPCPSCGKEHELQSKAGDPYLNRYTLADAPRVVKADLNGARMTCECGTTFGIVSEVIARVSLIPADEGGTDG
jgi:hypothetical protein